MQINKHGSFYIRNGWPTKIMDAVSDDALIFSPNKELDAVDDIGVGRVMIKAMRYWATAMGLTVESKTQSGVSHELTELGVLLANSDPYCQDKGTLWLLHRNLSRNVDDATAWYWAFNEFGAKSFTKDLFANEFYAFLQRNGGKYAKVAIEKEFDCFKNTYTSDKAFDIDKIIDEDTIPFFAPLKLIQYAGEGKFEMRRTTAKDIPLEIAWFCIISDNQEYLMENKQISVDRLLELPGQIGKYMNLSYASLLEILQLLENKAKLSLVNNFGNRYIELSDIPTIEILSEYYQQLAR